MKDVCKKTNPDQEDNELKICTLGISARMAVFLFLFLFLPMAATGICIEKGWLLPGKNLYLAVPLFFICLIVPFSRCIAYYLINRDLQVMDRFCHEIKNGNYAVHFRLPNQKEEEDPFMTLLRNLTWMSHHLDHRERRIQDRFERIKHEYTELEKKAVTDQLTGLFNRYYLEKCSDCLPDSGLFQQVSVLYIDCDRFKSVNDIHGHARGDELLVWLADCLNKACRLNHDIPIRLGGDEFAVLLPGADAAQAEAVGKRIRVIYHSREVYDTSLSIGISYTHTLDSGEPIALDMLIKNADEQTYVVKQAGGDNICIDNVINNNISDSDFQKTKIHKLANFDLLTGLPNRYLARERFLRALHRARRRRQKFCLMFLDLDDFKTVNDSLGHQMGDEYLKHMTSTLKALLRAEDTICRMGGDEFLVITENIQQTEDIITLVKKVTDAIQQPVRINGQQITITTSVGIIQVPDDGEDFNDICRRGEIALFRAKECGRNNFCFFDEKMDDSVNNSMDMISELRSAVALNQLELYFQPQIDLRDGRVIGAEALIRWNHPERGLLSPAVFIPLAERSGQIIEIGEWIIDQACRICAQWSLYHDLVVAVNISPIQVTRGTLADSVLSAIERYNLDGSRIELEFTESLLLHNSRETLRDLGRMRAAGIHFAIDDFGTGYSNLNYLKLFDITRLKVDRSFIKSMITNNQDQAIVAAIIQMAAGLNIDVVAEGIEDEQTMQLLHSMGCSTGQGYYWAKPLPAEQFSFFLNTSSKLSVNA